MTDLKPANENPWYVLANLYGEQDGDEIDWELHEKNKTVWNAWACQALTDEERAELEKVHDGNLPSVRKWPYIKPETHRVFRYEWKKRNGDLACPNILDGLLPIDFSEVYFAGNFIFKNPSIFSGCRFHSPCDFSFATFLDDVSFVGTKFDGTANFSCGTFFCRTNFLMAEFEANCLFLRTNFVSSPMNTGVANFREVKFQKEAIFASSTFGRNIHFDSANFHQSAVFADSKFLAHAYFSKTIFGMAESNFICEANFTDVQFDWPVSFRETLFHNSFPIFDGAILPEKIAFSARSSFWPRIGSPIVPSARAKTSLAIIRHAVSKQGLPEDEHFFFRYEMYYAGKSGSLGHYLMCQLFSLVSKYGNSIGRPLLSLAILFVAFSMIFLAIFNWQNEFNGGMYNWYDAWALSFSNIFRFLGLQGTYLGRDFMLGLGPVTSVLSALQTILGFTFLFFLGLGLRQRFRLR